MYIQVMSEDEANNMEVNPFDLTKMWLKKIIHSSKLENLN
nr:catalase [Anaerococcus obesiensis]